MKIHDVKIVLEKDFYYSGTKVTGKLLVKTSDKDWGKNGKVFVKFYDKLDIEWSEDEMISVGYVRRSYTNLKKPFQLDVEKLFDQHQAVLTNTPDDSDHDYRFIYPFEFDTPKVLQGTLNVKYAKNQYFIKAYLSNDEEVAKHYHEGANIFDEFFKSLSHTFCKQEVIILNEAAQLTQIAYEKKTFEAKTSHIKVTVTLPKLCYARGETVPLHISIQHADDSQKQLELHKVGFKLFQLVKLIADVPHNKVRLFEMLIQHSSRKSIHENTQGGIILEEFIQVPKDIPPTSSRQFTIDENGQPKKHPIRVNYKISLEFWKNFLVDELDVNVPILIDPEA